MVISSLHCCSQLANILSRNFSALFIFIPLVFHVSYALVKLMYMLSMCFPISVPWLYFPLFTSFFISMCSNPNQTPHLPWQSPWKLHITCFFPLLHLNFTCFCTFLMTLISMCHSCWFSLSLLLVGELLEGSMSDSPLFPFILSMLMMALSIYNVRTSQLCLFPATWPRVSYLTFLTLNFFSNVEYQ